VIDPDPNLIGGHVTYRHLRCNVCSKQLGIRVVQETVVLFDPPDFEGKAGAQHRNELFRHVVKRRATYALVFSLALPMVLILVSLGKWGLGLALQSPGLLNFRNMSAIPVIACLAIGAVALCVSVGKTYFALREGTVLFSVAEGVFFKRWSYSKVRPANGRVANIVTGVGILSTDVVHSVGPAGTGFKNSNNDRYYAIKPAMKGRTVIGGGNFLIEHPQRSNR
jgi:uncharacterized membrane protein